MAYIPPVSIPSLSGKNYAGELYGMLSGVGEAYYGAKRDKIGDEQWAAQQAQAKTIADRNYALDLQKFQAAQAGGGSDETWYGSSQWYDLDGTGPGTDMGFGVMSDQGNFKEVPPPPGAKWAPRVTYQDAGTSRIPTYNQGGGVAGVPPINVDVLGANQQKTIGTGKGEAAIALPGIQHNVARAVQGVDDLLSDPELLNVIGPIEGRLPSVSWDGSRERAQSRVDYVVGQVFQQAYDAIRGAGPISQYETQAARDAYARVQNQTMGDADYKEALQDFKNELLALGALAERKAAAEASGQGGQPQQAPGQPIYVDPDGTEVYEAQ